MGTVILNRQPRQWECTHCPATAVTSFDTPNRFHECPGLAGITAPMIPAGSGARTVVVERQDYVNGEIVTCDGNGRPVMAVVTERPDGSNDVTVFADTARGAAEV